MVPTSRRSAADGVDGTTVEWLLKVSLRKKQEEEKKKEEEEKEEKAKEQLTKEEMDLVVERRDPDSWIPATDDNGAWYHCHRLTDRSVWRGRRGERGRCQRPLLDPLAPGNLDIHVPLATASTCSVSGSPEEHRNFDFLGDDFVRGFRILCAGSTADTV